MPRSSSTRKCCRTRRSIRPADVRRAPGHRPGQLRPDAHHRDAPVDKLQHRTVKAGGGAVHPHRRRHQAVRRLRRRRQRVARHLQGRDLLRCSAARAAARPRCCACWPASRRRPPAASCIDGAGHGRRAALRAAGQHDVPVLRAVPAHDGGAERRLRPEAGRHAAGRDRRARRRDARPGAAGRLRQAQAAPALRRPAQRVALARAWSSSRKLLLLDEPLGALDKKLREETQFELVNIQEKLGVTFVIVTHDQEEAMTLADAHRRHERRRIVQVGTPQRDLRVSRLRASSPTSSAP